MTDPGRPITDPGAPTTDARQGLPLAIWIGTAIFAVLSLAALVLCMRMGRQAIEAASAEKIERSMRDSQTEVERRRTSSGEDRAPAAPRRQL